MMNGSLLFKLWLAILCVLAGTASAEISLSHSELNGVFSNPVAPFPVPFVHIDGVREDLARPAGKILLLDLGADVLQLRTSYLERREELSVLADPSTDSNVRRYVNLLATSSQFDGKLVGEGEVAYSILGSSIAVDDQPRMLRLGINGRRQGLRYGGEYRSFGSGFVSITGTRIDQDRDEGLLWAEHDLGPFRVRGSLAELWERVPDTNELSITKTATTTFSFNKPNWSAALSSSYALIGQEASNQNTVAFTNALSASYRPMQILTVMPILSMKEEWDSVTGMRTETPSAEVVLIYSPLRDFQLTGRTSYTRGIGEDGVRATSTVNTVTALNWNIGNSAGIQRFLSFQIEYNNHIDFDSPSSSQGKFSGRVQLKIFRF